MVRFSLAVCKRALNLIDEQFETCYFQVAFYAFQNEVKVLVGTHAYPGECEAELLEANVIRHEF